MHFVFRIVLVVQICIYQCHSEWVKIPQTSDENKTEKPEVTPQNEPKGIHLDDPSPIWIEYQKQRFSGANISQKLVISGESHLKTSAEVVVPAQINDLTVKRNKILPTSTKISFEDSASGEVDPSSTEPTLESLRISQMANPKMNTTSDRDLKFPSFVGFLNYLTSLQRTLLIKTTFGIRDKIKMLKKLRDQLMLNIEQRFGLMFPKSRQKRGLTDESTFQFPSETALMSISFLTFSVFLIKLVLQVIHVIKSKHYTYTGMTMNNLNTLAKSGMNARKFGESYEDLETVRKVSAAIKLNPFSIK